MSMVMSTICMIVVLENSVERPVAERTVGRQGAAARQCAQEHAHKARARTHAWTDQSALITPPMPAMSLLMNSVIPTSVSAYLGVQFTLEHRTCGSFFRHSACAAETTSRSVRESCNAHSYREFVGAAGDSAGACCPALGLAGLARVGTRLPNRFRPSPCALRLSSCALPRRRRRFMTSARLSVSSAPAA